MTQPAIELDHVVRRFGGLTAVDGITLDVARGEIFGVLGHNGAGKTTLIRLITGLLQAGEGRITTLGFDPVTHGSDVRSRTGVLTEYPALDHFLTPLENLAVYATINGMDRDGSLRRAHALLEQLDLLSHRDVAAHSLSAGLKQRVALARALVHDPELLLLDEPTSNLDPLAARAVRDLVLELSRQHGRTVLLSTHNLVEAQYLCDRIAIVRHGRLLALGSLDDMRAGLSVGTVQVSVAPDDAPRAAPAVAALPAALVTPLARPGDFEVRIGQEQIPKVVQALVSAGVRVQAVRPATPTLEDVYLSLHEPSTVPTLDDVAAER